MTLQKTPRIAFMGTPDFAVASLKALIENGYNIVAVITAPDKPAGRGMQLKASAVKEYALSQQLPILQPDKLKNPDFIESLKALEIDLQIVVAFRMLPEVVWNMPPMGTLNVHGSLLPQYRGAAPINWAIINGETETGVTTFKLKHEIDTGNILLQERTAIQENDNFGTIYQKLMQSGAGLLLKTIEGLLNGSVSERPQPESGPELKHAPKIFKEDCQIYWKKKSAAQAHNLIRGLAPFPAAFTFLGEKQLKIFESGFEEKATGVEAGTVDSDGKTYLRFAATDGWVYATDVQYEGKKRMKIEDFLRGFRM